MERIYGIPINDKEALMKEDISFKDIAQKSVELFFIQVFEHNFFHADMHPGNILFRNTMTFRFVLVDFGIMGSLSEFDKKYLAENFIAFLIEITQVLQNYMLNVNGFPKTPIFHHLRVRLEKIVNVCWINLSKMFRLAILL